MDPPFWHCMDLAAANRARLLRLIAAERSTVPAQPLPPVLPAQLDLFA